MPRRGRSPPRPRAAFSARRRTAASTAARDRHRRALQSVRPSSRSDSVSRSSIRRPSRSECRSMTPRNLRGQLRVVERADPSKRLRIAADGGQRRAQLVRDVGDEVAAHGLQLLQLGDRRAGRARSRRPRRRRPGGAPRSPQHVGPVPALEGHVVRRDPAPAATVTHQLAERGVTAHLDQGTPARRGVGRQGRGARGRAGSAGRTARQIVTSTPSTMPARMASAVPALTRSSPIVPPMRRASSRAAPRAFRRRRVARARR